MHVDISNNGFNETDSREIARGLSMNSNIYGFHFEGNFPELIVNPCGFLGSHKEEEESILEKSKSVPDSIR